MSLVKRTIRLIDSFIARASVLSTNQNATKQFFCLGGLGEGRWRAFQQRQKWVIFTLGAYVSPRSDPALRTRAYGR
jgi:hypothetical protein